MRVWLVSKKSEYDIIQKPALPKKQETTRRLLGPFLGFERIFIEAVEIK